MKISPKKILPRATSLTLVVSMLLVACQSQKSYQVKAEEIFPPVKITKAALMRIGKPGITPAFFMGQSTAVVFGRADCDDACAHRLQHINDSEKSTGLFVVRDLADHRHLQALQDRFPSVEVAMGVTAASLDNFAAQFASDIELCQGLEPCIYLVDGKGVLTHAIPAVLLATGDLDREFAAIGERNRTAIGY